MSVTVLVPTWNRPEWLRETLTSLIAQTYTDWRAIVADNGSDCGPQPDIALLDERIEYVWFSRHEFSNAHGLRYLPMWREGYGCFLHDDDLLSPDNLERRVAYLDEHPDIGVVVTALEYFGNMTGIRDRDPARWTEDFATSWYDMTNTPTLMYRSPDLVPAPDPTITTGVNDGVMQYEMYMRGVRFGYIPEPLYLYRVHGAQESSRTVLQANPDYLEEIARIMQRAEAIRREVLGSDD